MPHIIVGKHHWSEFFCITWDLSTSAVDGEGFTYARLFMIYAGIIGAIRRKIRSSATRLTKGASGVFLK